MTLNPLAGAIHRPIFLRKTPFPSRIDWRQRILLLARSISSRSNTAPRLESFDDWYIVPDGVTINKAETANKIVFIGFDCNVYTDEFSSELGARLFDRKRFTIARETRDKRRVEETGLNNFFNITEIAKLDEGIIFSGDKVLFNRRNN